MGQILIHIYNIVKKEREKRKAVAVKEKGESGDCEMTCTIATCKRTPRSPTAMEAAAMTAGPVRNLTAIAKAAMEFPHAMILGCKAMNRPVINQCLPSLPPPPTTLHTQKLCRSLTDSLLVATKRKTSS